MIDNDHAGHIAQQVEVWGLVRAAFDEEHEREPRFCPRCALDGLFIANMVGLKYMLDHAETDAERHEIEVAIMAHQNGRASQEAEHRA
jgi:hypothetical protein